MKILGLMEAMVKVFDLPKRPLKWGIVAKEKDKLLKPSSADSKKKAHRKMVQASRKANRG